MPFSPSLTKYTVPDDSSLLSALERMDSFHLNGLIVVRGDSAVGVLTDGDVRRALVRGAGMDEQVRNAMTAPFVSLQKDASPQTIVDTFRKDGSSIVPIVDDGGRLCNIMTHKIFEEILLSNNQISADFDLQQYENIETEFKVASRPWGYYKTMVLNETFQSKVVYVLPLQALSLQSHNRREEHWTIVSGEGLVQLNRSVRNVCPGDVVYIPKGCKHRISNKSDSEMLIFSEVQLGDYFGEDDIIRYDDIYGRSIDKNRFLLFSGLV